MIIQNSEQIIISYCYNGGYGGGTRSVGIDGHLILVYDDNTFEDDKAE